MKTKVLLLRFRNLTDIKIMGIFTCEKSAKLLNSILCVAPIKKLQFLVATKLHLLKKVQFLGLEKSTGKPRLKRTVFKKAYLSNCHKKLQFFFDLLKSAKNFDF